MSLRWSDFWRQKMSVDSLAAALAHRVVTVHCGVYERFYNIFTGIVDARCSSNVWQCHAGRNRPTLFYLSLTGMVHTLRPETMVRSPKIVFHRGSDFYVTYIMYYELAVFAYKLMFEVCCKQNIPLPRIFVRAQCAFTVIPYCFDRATRDALAMYAPTAWMHRLIDFERFSEFVEHAARQRDALRRRARDAHGLPPFEELEEELDRLADESSTSVVDVDSEASYSFDRDYRMRWRRVNKRTQQFFDMQAIAERVEQAQYHGQPLSQIDFSKRRFHLAVEMLRSEFWPTMRVLFLCYAAAHYFCNTCEQVSYDTLSDADIVRITRAGLGAVPDASHMPDVPRKEEHTRGFACYFLLRDFVMGPANQLYSEEQFQLLVEGYLRTIRTNLDIILDVDALATFLDQLVFMVNVMRQEAVTLADICRQCEQAGVPASLVAMARFAFWAPEMVSKYQRNQTDSISFKSRRIVPLTVHDGSAHAVTVARGWGDPNMVAMIGRIEQRCYDTVTLEFRSTDDKTPCPNPLEVQGSLRVASPNLRDGFTFCVVWTPLFAQRHVLAVMSKSEWQQLQQRDLLLTMAHHQRLNYGQFHATTGSRIAHHLVTNADPVPECLQALACLCGARRFSRKMFNDAQMRLAVHRINRILLAFTGGKRDTASMVALVAEACRDGTQHPLWNIVVSALTPRAEHVFWAQPDTVDTASIPWDDLPSELRRTVHDALTQATMAPSHIVDEWCEEQRAAHTTMPAVGPSTDGCAVAYGGVTYYPLDPTFVRENGKQVHLMLLDALLGLQHPGVIELCTAVRPQLAATKEATLPFLAEAPRPRSRVVELQERVEFKHNYMPAVLFAMALDDIPTIVQRADGPLQLEQLVDHVETGLANMFTEAERPAFPLFPAPILGTVPPSGRVDRSDEMRQFMYDNVPRPFVDALPYMLDAVYCNSYEAVMELQLKHEGTEDVSSV